MCVNRNTLLNWNSYFSVFWNCAGAVEISDFHFGIGRIPAYITVCSGMEPSLQACQNSELNHLFEPQFLFEAQLLFFQHGSASVECQNKSIDLTSEKKDN